MSFDHLNLGKDDKVRSIIQKHSDEIFDEIILYSNRVTKVNRKSKSQQRILLITNKAVYNFTPGAAKSRSFSIKTLFDSPSPSHTQTPHQELLNMSKKGSSRNLKTSLASPVPVGQMKRRIALKQIHTISLSTTVNQIVLHVPNEYDYLYRVANKKDIEQIVRVTQESSTKLNHTMPVWQFKLNDLSIISENNKARTKKNETQSQYMQRKLQLWQKKYSLKKYTVKKRTASAAVKPSHIRTATSPHVQVQRASYAFGGGTGGRQGSYFNHYPSNSVTPTITGNPINPNPQPIANPAPNKHSYFTPPPNNNNLQNQQFPPLVPLNQHNVMNQNANQNQSNQSNLPSFRHVHSDPPVHMHSAYGMAQAQHARNLTGNMHYPPPNYVGSGGPQPQCKGTKKQRKRRRKVSESRSSSGSCSSSRSRSRSSSSSSSSSRSSSCTTSSGSDNVSDTENGDATPTPTPQQIRVQPQLHPLRPSNTRLSKTPKTSPDMQSMQAMHTNENLMNGMNGMNINKFGRRNTTNHKSQSRHQNSHSAQFTRSNLNRFPISKQMPNKALPSAPSTPPNVNMNMNQGNNMRRDWNWKRNANMNNGVGVNDNNWNRNVNNNMNINANNTQNNWNRNANNNMNVNNNMNMNKQNGNVNNVNSMNANGQNAANANIKCVSTILEAKELNVQNKEAYLADHLFLQVFEMSKQEFYALRPWKQKKLKRNTGFW